MDLKSKAGHLAVASGHLVADCNCCTGCVDGCAFCNDCTPHTLTVTLSGTSIINDCVGCDSMGSMNGPGGTFDGVYTLVRMPGQCCWQTTFSTGDVNVYYGVDDCSGTPDVVKNTWIIQLCLFEETPGVFRWWFGVEWDFSGFPPVILFRADYQTTASQLCNSDLPTFTNLSDGTCLGPFPYAFAPGFGGTAVISFEAGTDTIENDCDCCPVNCSTCASLTATVSGLTGNCSCANGVYTLTVADCVWSYLGATAGDGDPFSVISIDYRCVSGVWTLTIQSLSTCMAGTPTYSGDFGGSATQVTAAGDQCGKLTTYTIHDAGLAVFCPGQTATVVIS